MHSCYRPIMQYLAAFAAIWFIANTAKAEPLAENTWPQWRGPTRDGFTTGSTNWPSNLNGLKQVWRQEFGPSYSGPIVASDRVFVTETIDESDEAVHALDRATGRTLWTARWTGAMEVPFFARANGDWIRATPAYDGESLFVAGMRDVLVSLDATTGEERWRIDFVERYGTSLPSFGCVSSPIVDGDHLYVQAGSSFVKIEKRTGKTVWRTLETTGRMLDSAFSSPIRTTLYGQDLLVVQTRAELTGVDPGSGSVLWRHAVPAFRGMNILTPTVYKNGILTSTHRNGTFFYDIKRDEGNWTVSESWRDKGQAYMSSPIVIDDHAYMHLGNGRLSCLDLRTGEQTWRTSSMGKYWSTLR